MRILAAIAKWCGHLWMALFAVAFVLSIIGTFLAEPSLAAGWRAFTERFSPYSLANIATTIALVAPGLLLYRASDYFKSRSERSLAGSEALGRAPRD